MSSNIISMADKLQDGTKQSPEDALKDALNDCGVNGALKNGKKLIILALDESDGEYITNWYQAGMKMSECVALLEISKTTFLREMGYLE